MATDIISSGNVNIASALFVSLQLDTGTYRFSDAYTTITVDSQDYIYLGDLLSVSNFQNDFSATQFASQIIISGVPKTPDFTNIVLNRNIKGGEVNIKRVFFDTDTLLPIANAAYQRFSGVISNYSIEEDTDFFDGKFTNSIVFECQSVYAVLAKKITGQRTNGSDRRRFFSGDASFDQVQFQSSIPEFG